MAKFWTCHWQFRYWRPDVNGEGQPVRTSGSNRFHERGVSSGDTVYVVSLGGGQLYLGGRMIVDRVISRDELVRITGRDGFYDASEWVVGVEGSGTILDLHRRLDPAITKRLRFESKAGPKEPFFVNDTDLDNQATRGVRELTRGSAVLLDRVIAATEQLPKSGQVLTVTDDLLEGGPSAFTQVEFRLPDEVPAGRPYNEGEVRRVEVNRYERDSQARRACIAAHGTTCCACGFSFAAAYGPVVDGYIHVHHLRPLSEAGGETEVDPVADLRPVCPNCHAVLHLDGQCRSIDELRQLLAQQRHAEPGAAADAAPRAGPRC